jgi:hypothetical protein
MTSPDTSPETALENAREHERKFEWLEASKSYGQALESRLEPVFFAPEIWERMGFCYGLASRQAEDLESFTRLRQLAVEAYGKAAELFGKENDLKNRGKSAECQAIAEYVRSWLASEPSKKREMLDNCLKFGKEGLEAYSSAGEQLNSGRLYNDLMLCLIERLYVSSDWKEMREVAQEGINCANKAIAILSKLDNKSELLRAYFLASLQSWYVANISEQEDQRKELARKSLSYSDEACKLSKEIGDPYSVAMSNWAAAQCTLFFTENAETALKCAEEMLRQGTNLRDNYLKGVACYLLTFVSNWIEKKEGDPDRSRERNELIIKYAEDAIRYLKLVSQDYFIAQTSLFYAESYSSLASDAEISQIEKRATLEKAIEIGRKGLEHATRSGSPDAACSTLHALSKALLFYSNLEAAKSQKATLLTEALAHRQEFDKIIQKALPSSDWPRGVGENYEGLIKAELAKAETDKDKKKDLLESALTNMEDGVSRCRRSTLSRLVPTLKASLGMYEDDFGRTLDELHTLTEDGQTLTRAIEAYRHAAEEFKEVNLPSRVAESYWKMARNQNRLGKHLEASENFGNAFIEYKLAAQKIPHFADFYLDYATYMNAWTEIEKAKSAHDHERYADATKHYEKTADLLRQTRLWTYLSKNFSALSLLEQAEEFSRKEQSEESIETFKKAAEAFEEAKAAFAQEIDKIQNLDEKEKATELSSASELRKDYCAARANVEEARIYDRKGEYGESAEKYDSAADIFEKMLDTMEKTADRREIERTAHMCRAWEKMEMADARLSPELYHEASELFLKAREYGTKDKTALLASGNSALCTALEHATKFEATREKEDFSKTKEHLASAANYYLKAGFDNASVCTSATETVIDAYNYMLRAEVESEPDKKIKSYALAEKCLTRSARLYERAEYVGKRDEVLKMLEKVKEKQEFALSLADLLTRPSDASSTSVIPAPAMTVEEPVGLLKFENEFIQANLIAHQKELVVGENFDLEIQLVNLGKKMAFLTKVEEIPPEGFDLLEKPEGCMVSDNYLNLKGRRLAPVETMEIKLMLKPRKKGKFVLTPKIQFMDETGKYKSCELEKLAVTVKELGIRGWLRGGD